VSAAAREVVQTSGQARDLEPSEEIGTVLADGRTLGPNGPIASWLPTFAEWQVMSPAAREAVQARAAHQPRDQVVPS